MSSAALTSPFRQQPVAARSLVLPSLRPASVDALNALIGTRRSASLTWGGQAIRLQFRASEPAPSPVGWLRVRLDGHVIELSLVALPALHAFDPAFAGIELTALPPDILAAVLSVWLEEVIAALAVRQITLTVDDWLTTPTADASGCALVLSRGGEDPLLTAAIHADEAALAHVASVVRRMPQVPDPAADLVPAAVKLIVGQLTLPLATCRTLAAGDVFLLALPAAALDSLPCELWLDHARIGRASHHAGRITLLAMNPSSDTSPAIDAATVVQVDDLPVQLIFEAGRLDLSFGQLRTLAPGQTFELPEPSSARVTVRVNGRVVGQGELVTVGDKLGVRLVNWSLA